ncbi:uncharacterized protein LOC126567538 [Anopheles maculipalpis]|uniref:uncharacterized protein LOC126567538 n=1 Tax=Anopheles maculipalpis TaxID=1496333 RepID=UPI00215988F1|nr:uncharacterized protein LOC126567538 [Anopheles maculipalpis]
MKLFGLLIFCVAAATALPLNEEVGEEHIPEPYKRVGEELIPEPYEEVGEEHIPQPYKRTGEELIPEPYKRTGEEQIPEPYKRTGEEQIPEPYKRTGEEQIPEPYKRTGEEQIPEPYKRTGEEQIPEPYEEQGYEQNWQLVPDGDGRLHLVNTDPFNLGTQDEPAPLFNADADTIFLLFTRNNRNSGHRITPGNAGTLGPHWNGGRQTRFIIHGWNNNGGSEVNVAIRNAYLDRADINVIVVDWGGGAQNPNYVTSRNHINAVGAAVARFIDFLNQSGGLAFNNVYVTGHSLGGHTAGIVGKRVTRGRLNTVVALDPALPLFSINDPGNRVASGDANYVEVIHTNGGLLGFDLPLGQADFYPNGGRSQPGCGVDLAGTCAHSRAHQFFAESVRPAQSGFNSVRCANYDQILNNNCVSSGANARMGGEPSNIGRGVNGVYFLTTNAQSPFARAHAASLSAPAPDQWMLIPDGNGRLHLANLNPYNIDETVPEPHFTAGTDTIFRLYTRSNRDTPQVLQLNNAGSVTSSNFNAANPTRFIIHGWNNDGFSEVNTILKDAWLDRGEFNVITVDWGVGAQTINYPFARARVSAVGNVVSTFINFLQFTTGITFASVSIAGHSLGAHAAGNAGFFQFGRLNTIFGMDPALPLFSLDSNDRLTLNDAQYVESIHTNAGLLGFDLPLGQASFYPNGGRTQPGCGVDITGACAHGRAYEFLAESIVSGGFTSVRCGSYDEILTGNCSVQGPSRPMGGEPSNFGTGAEGVFTLSTRAAAPFSLG